MDDAMPPPTEHILRPHHVGLLTILILTFKELDLKTIPSPFTLHLYRELLNEISEACLISNDQLSAVNCLQGFPPKIASRIVRRVEPRFTGRL